MKRIGVDTNVVLSFVTDRDLRQQARAAELFEAATAGEHVLLLHHGVVTEAVYVLRNAYGLRPARVAAAMSDLLSLPGVVTADGLDWREVWNLWPGGIKDFGDACLVAAAKGGTFDELATFDLRFARQARRQSVATYWA